MAFIAGAIQRALADVSNERALAAVADDVIALCRKFPAYPGRGYANAAA
jgi:glycine/serine hydroxymethyltransferase